MTVEKTCYYCHQPDGPGWRELRPYGPGGAPVCAGCGTSPAHEEETEKNFIKLLDEASSKTNNALISEDSYGPVPYIGKIP